MGARRYHALLERLPPGDLIGVEVGVFRGDMSVQLLTARQDLRLIMVDIEWRDDPLDATEFAADRREYIHLPSVEAAKTIDDGTLDFVFIDADHSYEAVKADIKAWQPKLKPNGLLCGHDYAKPHFGVKQAVHELLGDNIELGAQDTWFRACPKT